MERARGLYTSCHGYDIKDQLKGRVRTGEPGSPEYYTLIRR
jgi:hypothetical protein